MTQNPAAVRAACFCRLCSVDVSQSQGIFLHAPHLTLLFPSGTARQPGTNKPQELLFLSHSFLCVSTSNKRVREVKKSNKTASGVFVYSSKETGFWFTNKTHIYIKSECTWKKAVVTGCINTTRKTLYHSN